MTKQYYLIKSDKNIDTLTVVDMKLLEFSEAVNHLMGGEILVLPDYETTQHADTFVKIDYTLPKPVTKIMYEPPSEQSAAWQRYSLSFNALSLQRSYLYDPDLYKYGTFFKIGDIVKYQAGGKPQADVVAHCYKDTDGGIYYQFTSSEDLYQLMQAGTGDSDFDPVDDITQNHTSMIASDGITNIRVLI